MDDDPNAGGSRPLLWDQDTSPLTVVQGETLQLPPLEMTTEALYQLAKAGHPVESVAKLWESELQRALTKQLLPWPYIPARPLHRAERIEAAWRNFWWRIRDLWPLQWKDRSEHDW